MEKLLPTAERYGKARNHFEDDDFIDRLNSRWTVRVLIMSIIIISGNMFGLKPISCWTPQDFAAPQIEYTNSICFQKGSYYLPTDEIEIPDRSKPRVDFISYYQWTPFILLGMILLFLFPRFLWHACPRRHGINISRLVKGIKDDDAERKGLKAANVALKNYLDIQNDLRRSICDHLPISKFFYEHTVAYFSIKLLYVVNCIGQFILLNKFLSFEFHGYGVEMLKRIHQGEDWFESRRFPRVTMCDFMIRRLGSNQHWYSVQCNLQFNMYNEKIFFGIWLWLIILSIFNLCSIIPWIISLTVRNRSATIGRYLRIAQAIQFNEKKKDEKVKTISKSVTKEEHNIVQNHGNDRPPTRTFQTVRKDMTTEEETVPIRQPDDESSISIERRHRGDINGEINALRDYFQLDGYLMIRLITRNTDEIIGGRIINYLRNAPRYVPRRDTDVEHERLNTNSAV